MNVIFGLGIIAFTVGFGIFLVPMARELFIDEPLMLIGGALVVVPLLLLLLIIGLVFIFSPDDVFSSPDLVEGACYRAYGKTTVIPVGKVFVPIQGVNLVEIMCP